jgi:hypothetical protein
LWEDRTDERPIGRERLILIAVEPSDNLASRAARTMAF